MVRSALRRLALAVAFSMALCGARAAQAHFVWISSQADETGDRWAKAWFAETPEPGEPHLVSRLTGIEGWIRAAGGETTPLEWRTAEGDEPRELVATLPRLDAWVLEAHRQYGVFQRGEGAPILLEYYAKHLGAVQAENWAELARSTRLPLDVVPQFSGERLTITALWQDKPAAGAEISVRTPAGDEQTLTADDQGQVTLAAGAAGTYAARARLVEADHSGELDGKQYSGVWHLTTATFARPLGTATAAAGDAPTAAQLLSQARGHRALWHQFPGFTSDLRVRIDQADLKGRMSVSASGKVELELADCPHRSWIDEQLASLVNHRMPETPFTEAAEFQVEDGHHALGRLLKLEDAGMGSMYRVQDDVITEVNRDAGPMRFTISVLSVELNREGQYLPGVFTASFWNRKSGDLMMSQTFVHHWTRVGSFDLPERLQIVHTGKNERRVLDIAFGQPSLMAPAAGDDAQAAR